MLKFLIYPLTLFFLISCIPSGVEQISVVRDQAITIRDFPKESQQVHYGGVLRGCILALKSGNQLIDDDNAFEICKLLSNATSINDDDDFDVFEYTDALFSE